MGERCTVEGTVQHVIFQNEENGYTVLGLLTEEGELVTVVGCIPCVAPGEKLTADGLWVSHPSYGQQFAAETVERLMPETEEELISYLSSGIIKGVGPATAERLVERFGGELVTIRFDDRTSVYTPDLLSQLDMAYAMTVHKAQGSEYRAVVLVSAPAAASLMVRGVLYTAITRARELLVMVGDDVIPGKMAENDRQARRYSGLRRRLMQGGGSDGASG